MNTKYTVILPEILEAWRGDIEAALDLFLEIYPMRHFTVDVKNKLTSRCLGTGYVQRGLAYVYWRLHVSYSAQTGVDFTDMLIGTIIHEVKHIHQYRNGVTKFTAEHEKDSDDTAIEIVGKNLPRSYSRGKYWNDRNNLKRYRNCQGYRFRKAYR